MKNNLVAKNMHKTSKSVIHVDRKKRGKRGYSKFKKSFEAMI